CGPDKGAISREACRTSHDGTHIVDSKCSTRVSPGEYPKILHPTCFSPQKSAHPPWAFRISNDIPVVVDPASLARRISRQRPKIAYIAVCGPKDGTLTGRAPRCTRNLIQVVDVRCAAVIAAG